MKNFMYACLSFIILSLFTITSANAQFNFTRRNVKVYYDLDVPSSIKTDFVFKYDDTDINLYGFPVDVEFSLVGMLIDDEWNIQHIVLATDSVEDLPNLGYFVPDLEELDLNEYLFPGEQWAGEFYIVAEITADSNFIDNLQSEFSVGISSPQAMVVHYDSVVSRTATTLTADWYYNDVRPGNTRCKLELHQEVEGNWISKGSKVLDDDTGEVLTDGIVGRRQLHFDNITPFEGGNFRYRGIWSNASGDHETDWKIVTVPDPSI